MMRLSILTALLLTLGCGHSKKVEPHRELSALPGTTYSQASQMPVEEFFRNPVMSRYRVSPDGKQAALMRPWRGRMNVFVHDLATPNKQRQLTFVEDRDLGDLMWKGNRYLIYTRDFGGDENDNVFVVDVATGTTKNLTPFPGVKASVTDDLKTVSPTDILIEHNQRNREVFDVYRVNIETGVSQMVAENRYQISEWLIDHQGQPRGGVATDGVDTKVYLQKQAGGPMEVLFQTGFRNAFFPVSFAANNRNLYVVTNVGTDLMRLVEINPAQKQNRWEVRTLYSHPKYDLTDANYSDVRQTIGSVKVITDREQTIFLNAADQSDWQDLAKKFAPANVVLASYSENERIWMIRTLSDVSLGSYYVFDRDTKELTALGDVAPWVKPDLMSNMKTIQYRARDGLTIEAYLTLPKGKEPVQLPFVILPHGGPWARDVWGYDSEAQFLASRGYGVLQMNFRGSTGYGRKFWEKSFKQWGQRMQDDITDGVKWLIRKGLADPKRVCIYGASYGGYATLAGLTFTPDLYACGVDYVGVSNLFTFLNTIPPYWKPYLEQMYAMVGDPKKDTAMLRAASPVFHVDRLKAPLFVAQGAKDPRVVKAESDQIVQALRRRGVDVEYMVKDNEGHGFRNEENRFDFYRAMERFLANHLGAKP